MSEDLTQKLPNSDGEKLNQILTTVQSLTSDVSDIKFRVGKLEQTVEERLHDTRPIWEKVTADIAALQLSQDRFQKQQELFQAQHERFQSQQEHFQAQQENFEGRQNDFEGSLRRLEEGMELLRADSRDVKTHIRDIFRRLSIFNDTLMTMQADYRDIYDRVRGLELRGT